MTMKPTAAKLFQAHRHDKANGCFSQLFEHAYKSTPIFYVTIVTQQFANTACLPHSWVCT